MAPDPGGPKTYESYGSGFGSESATLVEAISSRESFVCCQVQGGRYPTTSSLRESPFVYELFLQGVLSYPGRGWKLFLPSPIVSGSTLPFIQPGKDWILSLPITPVGP